MYTLELRVGVTLERRPVFLQEQQIDKSAQYRELSTYLPSKVRRLVFADRCVGRTLAWPVKHNNVQQDVSQSGSLSGNGCMLQVVGRRLSLEPTAVVGLGQCFRRF